MSTFLHGLYQIVGGIDKTHGTVDNDKSRDRNGFCEPMAKDI